MDQFIPGGLTLIETGPIASMLEEAGLDAIHATAGDPNSADHFPAPPMFSPRGCYVPLAEGLKRYVHIPVGAVGRINNPASAVQILEEGKADLINLGRSFLADPEFLTKVKEGRTADIRPCIGCNQGCRGRDRTKYFAVHCSVNPEIGKEKEYRIKPLRHRVIIGEKAEHGSRQVAALRNDVASARRGELESTFLAQASREEEIHTTEYLIYQLMKLSESIIEPSRKHSIHS
jgi:tRNA-dihydrouridine synthase